jgi:hypothetical protein
MTPTNVPDDERCRHCGASLLVPGPWRSGGHLYVGLIAAGVQLQSALVQALGSYLVTNYAPATRILPFASQWVSNLPVPAILRAAVWAAVVLLLLGDYGCGYVIAALAAAVDITWAEVGYRLGVFGARQAALNGGVALIIFLIGRMAVINQAQSRLRLRVAPDRNL